MVRATKGITDEGGIKVEVLVRVNNNHLEGDEGKTKGENDGGGFGEEFKETSKGIGHDKNEGDEDEVVVAPTVVDGGVGDILHDDGTDGHEEAEDDKKVDANGLKVFDEEKDGGKNEGAK